MLTSDLAMSWRRGNRISPRYIQADDPRLLQTAADLALITQQHQGRRRAELERALDEYIGVGTDYKILRGLIKLLLDRCTFEAVCARDPAEIRRLLFTKAGAHHPVIANEELRERLLAEVAVELECAPKEVAEGLYADLTDNEKLVTFEELSAPELLDRYNLAQAQALLYRCSEMQLRVEPQEPSLTRSLFAEIKAFRLIHAIKGNPANGYEIRLSGPVSIFHRSQKYGIQMAVFLPALLLYHGWRMRAEIGTKTGTAFFELDSRQDRLRSHYLVDNHSPQNPMLVKLVEDWQNLPGEWEMRSSQEVIDLGESAFIPDLVFKWRNHDPIHLEIFGYWTPHHLSARLREFERAGFKNYFIVASEELRCSREAPTQLSPNVFICKKSLNARELQLKLTRFVEPD